MEVQRVVPSWLASLNTIKIPTPWMGGVFCYTTKVWKWILRYGSAEG